MDLVGEAHFIPEVKARALARLSVPMPTGMRASRNFLSGIFPLLSSRLPAWAMGNSGPERLMSDIS